jgi:hypothetical protein
MRVPNTLTEVFAASAVEGLVGQEPRCALGHARVVAAEQDSAGLLVTIELTPSR